MLDLLIELSIAACLFGIFACLVSEELQAMRSRSPLQLAYLNRDDGSGVVDVYSGRQRIGDATQVAPKSYRFRSVDGREVTATSMQGAVELGTRRG